MRIGVYRRLSTVARGVTAGLTVALVATLSPRVPDLPVAAASVPSRAQADRSVPVTDWRPQRVAGERVDVFSAPRVQWPRPASRVVGLPASGGVSFEVGGLPVSIAPVASTGKPPAQVRVEVLDRSAVRMLPQVATAIRVMPADGGGSDAVPVRVAVDYSDVRGAYGGDWASRLRLARVPECALDADGDGGTDGTGGKDCAGPAWLRSENDVAAAMVSATVDMTDEVLALLAGATGDSGDFTRSDLKASYSWMQGGLAGDFQWSYPIDVPQVPGGLVPQVGLAYTSGAVDSQTAGQNVQPSWIGEGWGYSPPFIERTYRPCFDDRDTTPHWTELNDNPALCWRANNAQLFFNGKTTEIIRGDDAVWRLADDDGESVALLTGANNDDDNGEHWKVTTTDGTQYWFGRHFLPNGRGGTNSTATTLVFGNHSGEPCFSSAFADTSCLQAYRWSLDYVVDRHGNEMSYWYDTEYNRARVTESGTGWSWTSYYSYARAKRLTRIEYGTRVGDDPARPVPAKVSFFTEDRCLQDCRLDTGEPKPASWPDTPWDLHCDEFDGCASNTPATFFSTRRLTQIMTQVRKEGSVYSIVDRWNLAHEFLPTGNSTSPVLWLSSITRTAGATAFPPVTFEGARMPNRAFFDTTASNAPQKYRLAVVNTETGGQIRASYSTPAPDCLAGQTAPAPYSNGRRCFPRGTGSGQTWWHKYLLTQVIERDLVGGSPDVVHSYTLSNTGASTSVKWAFETGAAVWGASLGSRTWSDWRGWPRVTVRTGPIGGPRAQTDYLYFRGLHGDRADPAGATRTAQIDDDVFASTFTDNAWRAGQLLQARTFDVSDGTPVELRRWVPTQTNTGTRTVSSVFPSTFRSYIARISQQRSWDWDPGTASWQDRDHLDYTLDGLGRTVAMHDRQRGTCTRTTFADNTAKRLLEFPGRRQVARGTCTTAPVIPDDLLSDTRHYYDNLATHGAAPTLGNLTRTEVYGAGGWFTESTAGFDGYGRPTSGADGLGRTTSTGYTHNDAGLLTGITVTNAAGHVTTTVVEPRRGLATSMSDANGKTTTAAYDGAGRLTKVWSPGRPTSGAPDVEYGYSTTGTAPSFVSSKVLAPHGNQIISYEIYDGMLRPRQTQQTAPDGKRVVTDTVYSNRGLEEKISTFYNSATGPSSTLVSFDDTTVDRQLRYDYDLRDRRTAAQLWSLGQVLYETVTLYGFRTVATVPPQGGTVSRELHDARGNVVAARQYHTRDPNATAYDESTFGYDPLDRLVGVSDAAANRWTYTYDLAGRLVSTVDPDAGTSTMVYDNAGQRIRSTDARGLTLASVYDELGRRTAVHEGTPVGVKRAEWRYDTLAKGQLAAAARFDGGLAYVTAVTGYDDGYRPLGRSVTIPASTANGALAGVYTSGFTYHPDGSPATETLPAAGGLPAETLTYTYTDQGLPATTSGLDAYVAATAYRWDGSVAETRHGAAGRQVRQSWSFEEATGRTLTAQVDAETEPGVFTSRYTTEYGYDHAGNVRAVAGRTGGARDQVECFGYDHQRRLVEAWTAATWDCSAGPQRAGADPYHRSWTFEAAGNRLTQIDHDPAGDTTWTYRAGTTYGVRPHQVARITATGPQAGGTEQRFGYDAAGNMTQHTTDSGVVQTLVWDAEGHLASLTAAGQTTSYVYQADGARLLARDPGGTTLYLGSTEVRQSAGGPVTAIRYYDDTAVRSPTGLFWATNDRNGTPVVQTDAATLESDRRRMLPYGEPRGAQPAWEGSTGFVGGTVDGTRVIRLGARGYDPSLGRFTSIDPLIDHSDPAGWDGYAYAGNSPVTFADPEGLARSCLDYCGSDADRSAQRAEQKRREARARQRAAAARAKQQAAARAAGEAAARARQAAAATRARQQAEANRRRAEQARQEARRRQQHEAARQRRPMQARQNLEEVRRRQQQEAARAQQLQDMRWEQQHTSLDELSFFEKVNFWTDFLSRQWGVHNDPRNVQRENEQTVNYYCQLSAMTKATIGLTVTFIAFAPGMWPIGIGFALLEFYCAM